MKITMIAALLGATLPGGGAIAAVQNGTQTQDAPQRHMMHDPLTMADANQDGVVTRDEAAAAVTARFAKLDANRDGKITREERRAAREAMVGGMERRMRDGHGVPRGLGGPGAPGMKRGPDADGDGVVTLGEQRAQALKRFDFVDRNGDGRIDQAERDLVREMMREMSPRRHHHGRGPHRSDDMPAAPPPPPPPSGGN